jgi:hypothetical protein
MNFTEFLNEAKEGKNLHLEHLEDNILNRGVAGAREAIAFLQSLRDMLAGRSQSKINVTTKWDGCVDGDTLILTNLGDMTIREIVNNPELWLNLKIMGKQIEIDESDIFTNINNGVSQIGDKSWVEIEFENGSSIKLTADHEIHTTNRGWIKAEELTKDDDITEL